MTRPLPPATLNTKVPLIPKISLEQWATFKAVVDEGSFAKAAEKLNKSQSSISYAINALTASLPVPPLTLAGRRAVLTEAGKLLYRHASQLLSQAAAVERAASFLGGGWEAEICLVADSLTPLAPVLCALAGFSQQCSNTRLRLLETTLSGTDEALLNRQCQLVIMPRVPPGFWPVPLCEILMVPVARVDHPLLLLGRDLEEQDLRLHRQIVLRDSGLKREQDAGWLGAEQRWTTSHFSTSVAALKQGLGFAFVPEHLVRDDIKQGELAVLPLHGLRPRLVPLFLVLAEGDLAGPGVQFLAQALQKSFAAL